MAWIEKAKQGFRRFMTGRHGPDQLSMALVWGGLVLYLVDMFMGSGIFSLLGLAAYVVAVFRILSRDQAKRSAENQKYLRLLHTAKTTVRQAATRFQNRKQYKYFKCPRCHTWIRLPRHVGSVRVTCQHCHEQFDQTA